MLRDYQRNAVDQLYRWMGKNKGKNPVLVLPTGSGKSHIISALCTEIPDATVVVLARQKELLEQNASKLDEPAGVYCAALGRKEFKRITFASVQSLARNLDALPARVDAFIVDECHQVSPDEETQCRQIVAARPDARVIGLTATPYRLGQGLITNGGIFHDILDPITIEELVAKGYLAPLSSKRTKEEIDAIDVKIRGGDYVESELNKAVNQPERNARIAREIAEWGRARCSWILFCAGVDHAKAMAAELMHLGIMAACVHGETPQDERDRMLAAYKDGRLRCLTNCSVLTTGFDAPQTDLIAFLRPTMSPALYVQMGGRGMRICDGKTDCLVLDFAGLVAKHGPITAVRTPKEKADGNGEAPVKACDVCHELVATSTRICPGCGFEWPAPEPKPLARANDDIMAIETEEFRPDELDAYVYTGKSGKPMIRIDYMSHMGTERISEVLCLSHPEPTRGYAVQKGQRMCRDSGTPEPDDWEMLDDVANRLREMPPPAIVKVQQGEYRGWPKIKKRIWEVKWSPKREEEVCEETFGDDDFYF